MIVRLVDPNGNDVAPGEPGEIIVQGDSVMIGYWEDPENTKKALRDGWLYGDDIASCDEDGFYTFLERKGEIIIHGGENVGPQEVEDVINSYPVLMSRRAVLWVFLMRTTVRSWWLILSGNPI
jgi:acyl-CoA synthetase (AMP-forming)/AMP-acid ligase II